MVQICDADLMVSMHRLSTLIWAMLAITASSRACSMVEWVISVRPDFKVIVEDRGHPGRGLPVSISGDSALTDMSALTDKNGIAFFHGVRSGSHTVTVVSATGDEQQVAVNVTPRGEAEVEIPLYWLTTESISVRSLRGRLGIPHQSLNLVDGSGQTVKTVETNSRGEFDFENTLPGLYAIGARYFGQFVVEVDRGARFEELDLELGHGATSCIGSFLTDRNKCPRGDFRMDRLSGQVTDLSGASVPNAGIDLLNADNTAVEQLRSDADGKFTSSRNLTGAYELVARVPGFATYRATVHLGPTSELVHQTPLTILLSFGYPACYRPDPK